MAKEPHCPKCKETYIERKIKRLNEMMGGYKYPKLPIS